MHARRLLYSKAQTEAIICLFTPRKLSSAALYRNRNRKEVDSTTGIGTVPQRPRSRGPATAEMRLSSGHTDTEVIVRSLYWTKISSGLRKGSCTQCRQCAVSLYGVIHDGSSMYMISSSINDERVRQRSDLGDTDLMIASKMTKSDTITECSLGTKRY